MPSSSPPSSGSNRKRGERAEGGDGSNVSPLTVNRISVYLRSLRQLRDQGVDKVSSQQLARRFHLSSTQIRKDLAQFGEFGTRGVGYDVAELVDHLALLLGVDHVLRLAIIGMGNLGTALARFPAFNTGSFQVVAGFDNDPAKIGRRVGPIVVRPTAELAAVARQTGASIAILAVPAEAAAAAYEALVRAGVRAVLNFAPATLPPRPGCRVKNVDLRIHLEELAFYLARPG
jgi:redox-sensing transcriptional repressor